MIKLKAYMAINDIKGIDLAKRLNTSPQQISHWIKAGYCIITNNGRPMMIKPIRFID